MWFLFSIIALLCWSGSDLFSKIGCQGEKDKTAPLKMVMAVGLVMGLHAIYEIVIGGVLINWQIALSYLPVSLLYILSMAMGYIGLRYIELSISSPICNSSGAIVAIATIIMSGIGDMHWMQLAAIAIVAVGVVMLGVVEATEDSELRLKRQMASNRKYSKSWLALALPIAYCLLDAAGTFGDSLVLNTLHLDFIQSNVPAEFASVFQNGIPEFLADSEIGFSAEFLSQFTAEQGEYLRRFVTEMSDASSASANVAYELTFFLAGVVCFIYLVLIKNEPLVAKKERPKYIGAIFETVGQFFYIYALSDEANVAMAAPIISSYCAVSVLWSRVFLKEKLSLKHYLCIGAVLVGIVIMGVFDM